MPTTRTLPTRSKRISERIVRSNIAIGHIVGRPRGCAGARSLREQVLSNGRLRAPNFLLFVATKTFIPGCDQALSVLKHLGIGRAARGRFLLGGGHDPGM